MKIYIKFRIKKQSHLKIYRSSVSKVFASLFVLISLQAHAWSGLATTNAHSQNDPEYNAWLKQRFSEQHEALIPVVAVADMFFSCNRDRKNDTGNYSLTDLITEMDKNVLAEKLSVCLGDDTMQSEAALNYGLQGCFHGQLAHLSEEERDQKMKLVQQAISSLPLEERKKSFTQCVTEQAIHFLK